MKHRPFVIAMADAMERKLCKNDHKNDGIGFENQADVQARIVEELGELFASVFNQRLDQIGEAADVANMCGMLVATFSYPDERDVEQVPSWTAKAVEPGEG